MLRSLPFVIAVCFALSAVSFSQTGFETDFQLWNETHFIVPLTKKKDLSFILITSGRLGNNGKTATEGRLGGMISKKVNDYVSVGAGYQYRYSNSTFKQSRYEGRYIGWVTFTVPLIKKLTLVNRNQVQYEDRFSRPNATVIRNRLWLKREVTLGKRKVEAFVSFEPFYDTRIKGLARYRTQVGISNKFNKKFSGDLFYVRQDETGARTRPGTLNGIGTNFRVNF